MAMLHQVLDEIPDQYLSEYMDWLGKNLNDVLMILPEGDRSDPPEENIEMHRFIKEVKIIQKKLRFLTYLYATEINGYVNHEKLECLETRIRFMANNVGQLCLDILGYVVFDEVDTYEYYDIMYNSPYLLFLIVLVELEMKKIFLSDLKASKFTYSRTLKDKKLPKGFSHHLHSLLMYLKKEKLENSPDSVSAQNIDVAIDFLLVFLDVDASNHVINGKWFNEVMEKAGAIAGDVIYVIEKLLPSYINKDGTSRICLCSIQILEKAKDLKAQVETYYKSLKFTPSQFSTFYGLSFLDSLLRKLNEMLKSNLDFMMKPLLGNLEKELSTLISILEKELSSLSSIFRDVAKVTEMWSTDVALKPCCVVAPFKHLPTQHSNPVTDEEIVGFRNDIEKMIQSGMGDKGKRQLLESKVTGSKDKDDKDDILADMLMKSLMGKRYLFVLDDMWDCMEWDDLRLCFPDVGNRSIIVVTTRLEKVGKQVKYRIDPYTLPFLTTEESCKLLQKKLFQKEDFPPELQDVSQAVAEK
ncbi:hypothetical protein KY290_007855 [Solanum tuberosum]|uniref:NB-ARC domain-containing protein n=1 Tax=Solanum tuberosum TaxID=4113 RepID=A0ABQ7W8Q9_SOLTU|nr:hypothetical protein KY290_007855 [Solanum tuberosum]